MEGRLRSLWNQTWSTLNLLVEWSVGWSLRQGAGILSFPRSSPESLLFFLGESRQVYHFSILEELGGFCSNSFHSKSLSCCCFPRRCAVWGSAPGLLQQPRGRAGRAQPGLGVAGARGGAGGGAAGPGLPLAAEHTEHTAAGSASWTAAAGGCWASCGRCSCTSVSVAGAAGETGPREPLRAGGCGSGIPGLSPRGVGEVGGWERDLQLHRSLAAGSGVPGCPEARRSIITPSCSAGQGGKRLRSTARGSLCPGWDGPRVRLSSPERCPLSPARRPPACPSSPGAWRVPAGERSILHLVTTDVPPPRSAPGAKRRHHPALGTVLSSDISAPKRDAGAWGLIWSGAAQRVEDRDHQPGIVFRLGVWVVQALPQKQDGCIPAHLEPAMLCSTLETPSLRFPRGSCSARARDRLFSPGFVVG